MRPHIYGIVCGVSLMVNASLLIAQEVPSVTDSAHDDAATSALDLVRQALQAEVEGSTERRAAWLAEALRVDPDCAPARWQSGFVRVDGQWLSLAEAQSKFSADPRLADYRQVRESLAESAQKQLLLARWCQSRRLADEARFHWLNVLRAQPDHAEALGALGVQWYNGLLLTPEQVDQQKRKDFKASRIATRASLTRKRWESTIAHWELAAGQGDENLMATMEADLAADQSGSAVMLVNHLVGQRSQKPKDPAACQAVNLNWIAILAKDPTLTKYLVMHAIGHPMEPVRAAAADALAKRPREDYVPLLLACARFPVEFACSVLAVGGFASAQYTLDIQGLEADTQIGHSDTLQVVEDFYSPGIFRLHAYDFWDGRPTEVVGSPPTPQDPARPVYPTLFAASSLASARDMKTFVDRYNAASVEINRRVTEALARATGEDLEANPRVWQKWWTEYLQDYYELESSPADGYSGRPGSLASQTESYGRPGGLSEERPVYRYETSSSRYSLPNIVPQSSTHDYVPEPPPIPKRSCFRGSTLVWTMTGPRAIETILPGDRVLSQNIGTGELAYKSVEQVTKRAPSPMMKIIVGGEEIVSTLGHPFWVNGKRWVMAKHLEPGNVLHTISGPRAIDTVAEIPAATEWYEVSYNLQVADFHTYFVGENQVLVHHLSMLSILDEGSSQVPGW